MGLPLREAGHSLPQLVSLFTMLKAYAHTYSLWVGDLAQLEEVLRSRRERSGDTHPVGGSEFDVAKMHRWLQSLRDDATALDLRSVWKQVDHMRERFTPEAPLVDALVMVTELRRRIQEDLVDRRFYYVHHTQEDYYLHPEYRWKDVWAKFPKTQYDAEEAGRCLAVGRHTACVFHLMRVAEIGLRALARRLDVRFEKKRPLDFRDWGDLFKALEAKHREMQQQKVGKRRERQFEYYGEMILHMSAFKEMWRNHVMHAREPYDELQALRVHLHVQGLMARLAAGVPK